MSRIQEKYTKSADKTVGRDLRSLSWEIFTAYEFGMADGFTYIHAPVLRRADSEADPDHISVGDRSLAHNKAKDTYSPLVDYPALFLEFAQLVEEPGLDTETPEGRWLHGELETEKNVEVMLDWVQTYGVLGLSPVSPGRALDKARDLSKEQAERDLLTPAHRSKFIPSVRSIGEPPCLPPEQLWKIRGILDAGQPGPPMWRQVSTRGGPKDTVTRFVIEAIAANSILRLYEAASMPKRPGLDIIRSYMPENLREVIAPPSWYKEWALTEVWATTGNMVRDHCYPTPYRRRDGAFMTGWGFRSLLGAMWLQMLWLLTAPEEDVRRCLWCDRVITFEQPEQPAIPAWKNKRRRRRKIRKDKQYCDDHCRTVYDYHMREKLGRR
jgi:hypothetical protein